MRAYSTNERSMYLHENILYILHYYTWWVRVDGCRYVGSTVLYCVVHVDGIGVWCTTVPANRLNSNGLPELSLCCLWCVINSSNSGMAHPHPTQSTYSRKKYKNKQQNCQCHRFYFIYACFRCLEEHTLLVQIAHTTPLAMQNEYMVSNQKTNKQKTKKKQTQNENKNKMKWKISIQ